MTCALRALTLCDEQRLEQPEGDLATCLCWLEERAEEAGYHAVADGCRRQRAGLLERLDPDGRRSGYRTPSAGF